MMHRKYCHYFINVIEYAVMFQLVKNSVCYLVIEIVFSCSQIKVGHF